MFLVSLFTLSPSTKNIGRLNYSLGGYNKEEMMKIDDQTIQQLGKSSILDESGNSIEMSSLWKNQRAILMFIRHFG